MSAQRTILLFALVLLLAALAACSAGPLPAPPAPTTQPAEPTAAPAGQTPEAPAPSDDDWARVQAAGVLQVGSPLDNPPFNTYNDEWQPDGFEVALMTELAQRLGVKVEFKDIVFDSLLDTLELGRIDAVIAAMAITKERQQAADFTAAYYQGEDIVLAAANSSIPPVTDASGLAGHTIGVVRGTVYESWLNRQMRAGAIDISNLRSFSRPEDVVNALETGRVDLAVLDREPGLTFISQGKAKEVGKSTYVQDYAIALREGSTLAPKLNTELARLMADGTVKRLAEIYLALPPDKYTPVPPVTQEPAPTAPPQPTATPAPIDDLTAGKDVDLSIPDNSVMKSGQAFRKGWRLTNSGTTTWSPDYRVVYASGIPDSTLTQMGGLPTQIGSSVAPKGKVDVYVDLVAPKEPGTYKAFWQMENASGKPFGDQFWVQIVVPSPATPTPVPAPTARPGLTFAVNPPTVQLGQSTTISWNITGQVKSVYFCTQPSVGCEGVGQVDKRQRTPNSMPVTYYELQVEQTNGQWLVQPIPVNVVQPAGPTITGFSANAVGECADLWWQVSGNPRRVAIARIGMGEPAEDGASASGSKRDCPGISGPLTYELQVWAQGSANDQPPVAREQRTVTLQGPQPQPQVVERYDNDCGTSVNLRSGDMLVVHLKASSGTGYVWEQTEGDPGVMAQSGSEVTPGGGPGAQDEYTWRYDARGGYTRLGYTLRQSWDPSAAPANTCFFDVSVQ